MQTKSIIAAAAGFATAISVSTADTTLHIDVNDITATASGVGSAAGTGTGSPFTAQADSFAGYTGSLVFSIQGSSAIADLAIVGSGTLTGFFDLGGSGVEPLKAISGTISLVGNLVTGIGFTIEAWNSTGMASSTTYTASIASGTGLLVKVLSTGNYTIDGLTFAGMFSSSTYAGASVLPFFTVQPLQGNFLQFEIDPSVGSANTTGVFVNSQLDVFMVIPLPSTAGMGFVGLFGLACVRRRR